MWRVPGSDDGDQRLILIWKEFHLAWQALRPLEVHTRGKNASGRGRLGQSPEAGRAGAAFAISCKNIRVFVSRKRF